MADIDHTSIVYRRPNQRDLTGLQVGLLSAVEDVGAHEDGGRLWKCLCSGCGKEYFAKAGYLLKIHKRGAQASCGCTRYESKKTHGLSKHPAYVSWAHMIARCHDTNCDKFKHYGGRGITVADSWKSFGVFWQDMGASWKRGLSIDRIDVNGNYEKDNCQWSTQKQQANNTRSNRLINTPEGPMTLSQASEHYGIERTALAHRLDKGGWSTKDALTKPIRSITVAKLPKAHCV